MKILTITCENKEQAASFSAKGADEVIVALRDGCFSSLNSLSIDEILDLCAQNTKRTAVLMNRLFGQEEKEKAGDMLARILPGADAVFFADPCLMETAVRLQAQNKMIYRPETLLTSSQDAAWWMSQQLQSVQISPLLTKEEICLIASEVKHTGLQIHGRFLMSVSKRRLLSAYAEVSQGKQLYEKKELYLREDSREGRMPVYENAYGTMIYTDFIQESFDYIHAFMEAGVERFEIDTNGMPQEAAEDALILYRSLLDGSSAETESYLKKYSSLPFGTGYYGLKTVK